MFVPYLNYAIKYGILNMADKGKPCESVGRKITGLNYFPLLAENAVHSHKKALKMRLVQAK